jgi:hypothetical protein
MVPACFCFLLFLQIPASLPGAFASLRLCVKKPCYIPASVPPFFQHFSISVFSFFHKTPCNSTLSIRVHPCPSGVEKTFKKKLKKMLTPPLQFAIFASHTVTTEQQQHTKMRTKTLLMTAAALLAVGIVSSRADGPVYSQNVVGYANVVTPGNGATYYMLAVPFSIGASNGANEVFGTSLPNNSFILTWNAGSQTFDTVQFDGNQPAGPGEYWYNQAEDATVSPPALPVGQGFFLLPNGPVTNVFAGTVAVNVGTSNKMSLLGNGATYFMVSSVVPYGGVITNGNVVTGAGGPNLNGLPNNSFVLTWDAGSQSFTTVQYDGNAPAGDGLFWYNQAEDATVDPPSVSVGQGFFILPNGSYDWTTGL